MAKDKKEDELKNQETPDQTAHEEAKKEKSEQEKGHKTKKEKLTREQELEKQLAEKCEQFLRLAAEYDNYRKRSQREKDEIYAMSKTTVVKELLPVIDNFERAGNDQTESLADYKKGIEMIHSQFMEIIKKIGIETFGEAGDAFDPNIHTAVMHVEDEKLGENVIAQIFNKGYKLGEKIIRSAAVSVAN